MRQIVTTVKRGDNFLGQVIRDPSNARQPYGVHVILNGKEYEGGKFFDEDEAAENLDQFMYEIYQEHMGKPKKEKEGF